MPWSSAPARSNGHGGSTATTTAAVNPPTPTCSRRRSTSSPTWERSLTRSRPALWQRRNRLTRNRRRPRSPHQLRARRWKAVTPPPSRASPRIRRVRAAAARSPASKCRQMAARAGTPPRAATPGPTRGSRPRRARRRSRRGPSTTAATSISPAIRSPSTSPHAPAPARSGETPSLRATPVKTTRMRSRSASSSAPTKTATSPGCASTRVRATPARTSGISGLRAGHCSRKRPSRARPPPVGRRSSLPSPVADHRRHHLCRLLPRARRPLRGEPELLRRTLRQPAPARARRRRGRWQRRLQVRRLRNLPERNLQCRELLGRRRLRHRSWPGHDAADDHRALAGERRHRGADRRRRHRDVQRGDGPGDDQRDDRAAARFLQQLSCRPR